MNFSQEKCNYTKKGRELLGNNLLEQDVMIQIRKLSRVTPPNAKIEYTDNRLSKYSMQRGKCSVTGKFLYVDEVHCHHITPRSLGGNDKFKNLTIVHEEVHRLIHAVEEETIKRYVEKLNLDKDQIKKLNTYRKKCNLGRIVA